MNVAIVGGGPAGLMAAEVLCEAGCHVDLYDAMPSVGRKFLLAGIGGLNLTHNEPLPAFVSRYGARAADVQAWLDDFGPAAVRQWAAELGIATFVGSSQRVFPLDLKAAPLLRAWLHRLRTRGLRLHMRHRWTGFDTARAGTPGLLMNAPAGDLQVQTDAVVLALGGASWPRLGSDGRWQSVLAAAGVEVAPLQPANCGFDTEPWSEHLRERHAGAALKTIAMTWTGPDGQPRRQRGECVVTATGLEGSLVYAASADLREALAREGHATLWIDLLPDHDAERVAREVAHPRGSRSLGSHLKSRLGLSGVKAALLHECTPREALGDPAALAGHLKALPVRVRCPRPIDEAISSAGGVRLEALDGHGMLRALPGVFCAGEMLDWEAPTGGYLLTACLASGQAAGRGVLAWSRMAASAEATTAPPSAAIAPHYHNNNDDCFDQGNVAA
jgi:uncharacterized flavoprotein (TIGR03862 family)